MLVVMIAVGGMAMPVVGVVDVIVMVYWLVTAAGSMYVGMGCMSQVRQRMLVVVVIMRRMGVSFVHVINMSLALGACVSATGPVYMVVIVSMVLGGSHRSSLL